jgi:hypothetical protein
VFAAGRPATLPSGVAPRAQPQRLAGGGGPPRSPNLRVTEQCRWPVNGAAGVKSPKAGVRCFARPPPLLAGAQRSGAGG